MVQFDTQSVSLTGAHGWKPRSLTLSRVAPWISGSPGPHPRQLSHVARSRQRRRDNGDVGETVDEVGLSTRTSLTGLRIRFYTHTPSPIDSFPSLVTSGKGFPSTIRVGRLSTIPPDTTFPGSNVEPNPSGHSLRTSFDEERGSG